MGPPWRIDPTTHNTTEPHLAPLKVRESLPAVLTDCLYDVSEQNAICYVGLQVCDESLVSRLLQVVIRPVRVNLQHKQTQINSFVWIVEEK